tara:strand:- start:491 stop:1033 length:543 start_codon:yes stop_codon:yes gene_type:complete
MEVKMTRRVLVFLILISSLKASSTLHKVSNPRKTIDSFKSNQNSPIVYMGHGSKLRDVIRIGTIMSEPDKYVNKVITVQGKISDLCLKAGCWMSLVDLQGNKIVAKGNHSDIVFPEKSIDGKGRVTGKFKKHVLSLEQTIKFEAHMAKDRGEEFDPNSITEPKTLYRIHTTGAVIYLSSK